MLRKILLTALSLMTFIPAAAHCEPLALLAPFLMPVKCQNPIEKRV